jgi:P-type E1-E2 ATPase
MKRTGIKVWVLTGDKVETAINIGVSAGLLDDSMDQYIVDE